MLRNDRALVLSHIKYSENSIIVRVLGRESGPMALMVSGIYGKKSAMRISQFQPLNLLDIVYYHKGNRDLQRLKECRVYPQLHGIQGNVIKSAIALFCAEAIAHAGKEGAEDIPLFDRMEMFVLRLEAREDAFRMLPHYFLLELSSALGIEPDANSKGRFFNLLEGAFSNIPLTGGRTLNADLSARLLELFQNKEEMKPLSCSAEIQSELLEALVRYIELHLNGFGPLRSIDILHETLSP